MKFVRESHIEDDGTKYAVVDLEPGDTIPTTAIKVDKEWHVPEDNVKTTPEPTEDKTVRKRRVSKQG